MAEYYAITRSDDFLEHYGIKGMKWGVRKAIESGNTKALGRQYRKAQKKLAKLEKRANSGAKYARRAAALGIGAGALGAGAVLGNKANITRGIYDVAGRMGKFKQGAQLARKFGNAYSTNALGAAKKGIYSVAGKTGQFKKGAQLARKLENSYNGAVSAGKGAIYDVAGRTGQFKKGAQLARKFENRANNLSVGQVARLGAGAAAVGLAGAAGYNAYRAATTKRAARKAAQFRSEMNKAFAGTQYANGGRGGNRRRRRR